MFQELLSFGSTLLNFHRAQKDGLIGLFAIGIAILLVAMWDPFLSPIFYYFHIDQLLDKYGMYHPDIPFLSVYQIVMFLFVFYLAVVAPLFVVGMFFFFLFAQLFRNEKHKKLRNFLCLTIFLPFTLAILIVCLTFALILTIKYSLFGSPKHLQDLSNSFKNMKGKAKKEKLEPMEYLFKYVEQKDNIIGYGHDNPNFYYHVTVNDIPDRAKDKTTNEVSKEKALEMIRNVPLEQNDEFLIATTHDGTCYVMFPNFSFEADKFRAYKIKGELDYNKRTGTFFFKSFQLDLFKQKYYKRPDIWVPEPFYVCLTMNDIKAFYDIRHNIDVNEWLYHFKNLDRSGITESNYILGGTYLSYKNKMNHILKEMEQSSTPNEAKLHEKLYYEQLVSNYEEIQPYMEIYIQKYLEYLIKWKEISERFKAI